MGDKPVVGLFATCLVDLFRPSVGFAAAKLIEAAECTIVVPRNQTCCGQPAYNSGDKADAIKIAKRVIRAFRRYDYVVVPSGSCGGMIKKHYPGLFEGKRRWKKRADDLAARTFELTEFLSDVIGIGKVVGKFQGIAAYHDGCSGLRELGLRDQPRKLLAGMDGLAVRELPGRDVCCGFGGTFCVKYPEISDRMAGDKVQEIVASGCDTLLAGDMGCLMNLAGKLQREGHKIKVMHVAEVLAGMGHGAGIGESAPELKEVAAPVSPAPDPAAGS
ncbi:MAG: (Fe-S)-binding protein [Alphaproteobacteria bacterium]